MTNIDGEFKFRLWLKEDHRNSEIQVPKDFSGYLYIPSATHPFLIVNPGVAATEVRSARYRRYLLKRLLELSKSPK